MTEKVKEGNKGLTIFYNITFWIISVFNLLFGFILQICVLAGEIKLFIAGLIITMAAIGINPLWHKIKLKKDKVWNHLRRAICIILIILGLVILKSSGYKLIIKNNSLDNSHDEIIEVLNKDLKEIGYEIDSFKEVDVNEFGKENNFKIFEARIKEDKISIQLIEKNERIEAIRAATLYEEAMSDDTRRFS